MGTKPTRYYRPDLAEHYILVHPRKQWGIVRFHANKTACTVQSYWFDKDGDMQVGQTRKTTIKTGPRGPYISRQGVKAYLHDFIKALPNPYA